MAMRASDLDRQLPRCQTERGVLAQPLNLLGGDACLAHYYTGTQATA